MKTIFIAIATMFLAVSCAAIDAKKLERDIRNYTSVVEGVCTAAELFDAVGAEFPGVEQCKQVMRAVDTVRDYDDALAVSDALLCIQNHDVQSPDFVGCIKSIKQWPAIAERISTAVAVNK